MSGRTQIVCSIRLQQFTIQFGLKHPSTLWIKEANTLLLRYFSASTAAHTEQTPPSLPSDGGVTSRRWMVVSFLKMQSHLQAFAYSPTGGSSPNCKNIVVLIYRNFGFRWWVNNQITTAGMSVPSWMIGPPSFFPALY